MISLRKLTESARVRCPRHSTAKAATNEIKLCRKHTAERLEISEPAEVGFLRLCMIHPLGGFVEYQNIPPSLLLQCRLSRPTRPCAPTKRETPRKLEGNTVVVTVVPRH